MSIEKNGITIYEECVPNTPSNDRVTPSLSIVKQPLRATPLVQTKLATSKDDKSNVAPDNNTDKDKHDVERIARQNFEGDTLRYVLRWNGYGPKGNTV